MPRWLLSALAAALAVGSACGGAAPPPSPAANAGVIKLKASTSLSRGDLQSLAAAFADQPFTGGQTPPFLSRWFSDSTFMFVQFDRLRVADATGVAYLGVGTKGTFCSETQPDRDSGSFPVFHQASAAGWEAGLGGKAGGQGYWLSYLAVDELESGGRAVPLGVDYKMPGKSAPACGSATAPAFTTPGAGKPSADAIVKFFGLFGEQPLQGGQTAPRIFRTLNDQVLAFLQFDHNSAKTATELRYFGIWKKSTFCAATQPSRDFTHFHDLVAPSYGQGHGGKAGTVGFWGTWLAAEKFETQGRTVDPGVDRLFSPTPPPTTC